MIMVLEERFQKSLQIVNDKLGNYPRLEEIAWTRIERHKDGYLMLWRLHVKDETVGASIKAKLNRPETLPNEPSSHQLRRTTTSKKSLFTGPTKSQTRYTLIILLSLLNSLFFELYSLTLSLETLWLAPHWWPLERIPLLSLTLQESGRTCIGSLLDEPNH